MARKMKREKGKEGKKEKKKVARKTNREKGKEGKEESGKKMDVILADS